MADGLEARFRTVERKRAWPLALARLTACGAVVVSLWRDWPDMLTGEFSPLSAIALVFFVLVLVLPIWVFRPVAYFDEKIEVRIADLLPWVTLAVSAAKLLESLWPLLHSH
ncbi:MAG TPA: hypothetical protein VK464_17620 [Symbiobacteriaceae bacterium]|nr:hypothetical protein [Symbiobacteriaceae bacterium]